jgi:hypothetical protein
MMLCFVAAPMISEGNGFSPLAVLWQVASPRGTLVPITYNHPGNATHRRRMNGCERSLLVTPAANGDVLGPLQGLKN